MHSFCYFALLLSTIPLAKTQSPANNLDVKLFNELIPPSDELSQRSIRELFEPVTGVDAPRSNPEYHYDEEFGIVFGVAMACLFFMVLGLYGIAFCVNPDAKNYVIAIAGMAILDMASGIGFTYELWTVGDILFASISIFFLAFAVLFNLGLTISVMRSGNRRAGLHDWCRKYSILVVLAMIIPLCGFVGFSIFISEIFLCGLFHGPLSDMTTRIIAFGTLGHIIQDVPQIVINVYMISIGRSSIVAVISITTSVTTFFISIICLLMLYPVIRAPRKISFRTRKIVTKTAIVPELDGSAASSKGSKGSRGSTRGSKKSIRRERKSPLARSRYEPVPRTPDYRDSPNARIRALSGTPTGTPTGTPPSPAPKRVNRLPQLISQGSDVALVPRIGPTLLDGQALVSMKTEDLTLENLRKQVLELDNNFCIQ